MCTILLFTLEIITCFDKEENFEADQRATCQNKACLLQQSMNLYFCQIQLRTKRHLLESFHPEMGFFTFPTSINLMKKKNFQM